MAIAAGPGASAASAAGYGWTDDGWLYYEVWDGYGAYGPPPLTVKSGDEVSYTPPGTAYVTGIQGVISSYRGGGGTVTFGLRHPNGQWLDSNTNPNDWTDACLVSCGGTSPTPGDSPTSNLSYFSGTQAVLKLLGGGPSDYADLTYFNIDLDDPEAPTLTSADGGVTADWINTGTRTATAAATDPGLGVKKLELIIGTTVVGTKTRTCEPRDGLTACPQPLSGSITYDIATLPEGRLTLGLRAVDFADHVSPATTFPVNIDRTAPATPTGINALTTESSNSVFVYWNEASDPPLADASAGSGLASHSIRYRINGGAWSSWQSTVNQSLAIPGADSDDQIGVEVRSVDVAGNESAIAAATVVAGPRDVIKAEIFFDEPSTNEPALDAVDYFIPTTSISRYEQPDSIATRNHVVCGAAAGHCVEYRQRSRRGETNPAAADTFVRYRGTSPGDSRIAYAGDSDGIRELAVQNASDDTGAISNVKFSWQTLPPGAGTTYELYDSEIGVDEVAGTAIDGPSGEVDTPAYVNVRTRLVVDSATKLPLRLTHFDTSDGSLIARRIWSYAPSAIARNTLPADFFTASVPSVLLLNKQVEYADPAPSPLARSASGRPSPPTSADTPPAGFPELEASAKVTRGKLCYAYSKSTDYFEAASDAWQARQSPWLNVPYTRDASYYRLKRSGRSCPQAGSPDVAIESTSAAGGLAKAWLDEYQRHADQINLKDGRLGGGVEPVRLNALAKGQGYLLDVGAGQRAVFFERGSKAFLIRGRFQPADVQTLVSAVEE